MQLVCGWWLKTLDVFYGVCAFCVCTKTSNITYCYFIVTKSFYIYIIIIIITLQVIPDRRLVLHFFIKQVTLDQLKDLEKKSLMAPDFWDRSKYILLSHCTVYSFIHLD